MQLNVRQKQIQVDEELLRGDVLGNGDAPSILFLHGGGAGSKKRFTVIRRGLAAKNLTSIAFDFSGHGVSSSNGISSLSKRLNESRAWWPFLAKSDVRCIIGFSMGAEIAIRLTTAENKKATHLILVVGALYSKAAFNAPFGKDFRSIIRVSESWRDAETLEMIEKFDGHLAVISAENDIVIPSDLHRIIVSRATSARSVQHICMPDMEHMVGLQCETDSLFAEKFISLLSDIIRLPCSPH